MYFECISNNINYSLGFIIGPGHCHFDFAQDIIFNVTQQQQQSARYNL